MFRNKKPKNQYGTFATDRPQNKKTAKILITVLLGVIFVLGVGIALFRKANKPVQIAEVQQISATIPGWWYQQYFGSSVCTPQSSNWNVCKPDADPDHDVLTNAQEFYYHTDPNNNHTVGDKMSDGQLVAGGFDPSKSGKITFDQAANDGNIFGESLVFDKDIKSMISDMTDVNNAPLPDVSDASIKTSNDNSKQSISDYLNQLNNIFKKYFPDDVDIATLIKVQDPNGLDDLRTNTAKALSETEQITVPSDAVQLQKYQIGLLQTIPLIMVLPSQSELSDTTNVISNSWYDSVRTYTSLVQKTGIEATKLVKKYNVGK